MFLLDRATNRSSDVESSRMAACLTLTWNRRGGQAGRRAGQGGKERETPRGRVAFGLLSLRLAFEASGHLSGSSRSSLLLRAGLYLHVTHLVSAKCKQKGDETKPGPASVPFRSNDAGADRVNTLRKVRSTNRVTHTSVSPAWFRPREALLRLRGDAVPLAAAATVC